MPEGAQDGDQDDGEDERGDGLEELGYAHQRVVDEAAVEPGERPDQRAEGDGRQRGDDGDQQRGAGAVHESGSRSRPSESVPNRKSPSGGAKGLATMAKGLLGRGSARRPQARR